MKKNQLQLKNRLKNRLEMKSFTFLKKLKTIIIMAIMLLSVSWAQAATYYLTSAGAGTAQTPGSWNTNPAGGGTAATNFTSNTDVFIVPTGINGIVSGNWLFGSAATPSTLTLTINGTLTINSGFTLTLQSKNTDTCNMTVNGSLIFLGTGANQLIGDGNVRAKNTLILSAGAVLKTANTSGIEALTGTSSMNLTLVKTTLNTGANYEFNGAAQSTTGLPATVNNLTFSGAGSKTLAANVTVNGIYSIENGSNINTYTGTLSYGTNATLQYNSTGARTPGAEWVTPFTATGGVVIKNTGIVTLAVNKTVNLLTIAPNAKFTYNTGTLTATTFKIQSDATGTGTYLGTGTLTTTTTNVNQHLNVYRSWYMTSPVATNTPVPNTGSLAIYKYLESANDDQTNGVSWLTSTTMSPDKGFLVTPSGAGTNQITFTGALNNGTIPFALTRNDFAGKLKNGFNLIGNPYPSYLEWQELYAANSSVLSTATMWYRTKVGATYAFWTVNGAGGLGSPVAANDTIPPMQSFWVRTITGGGTLNMTNAMRAHNTTITPNLLKAPAAKTALNQILRLQVTNQITTDEAVVYFNQNAADGFDTFDSPKMFNGSGSSLSEIYTSIGAEELAINGMNAIPYDAEIPLYFVKNAAIGTTFSIAANELSNFEAGTQVWIKNNLSGVSQMVSDGTPYTFDIAETGTNPRFSVIFKAPGAVTKLANTNNRTIFAYSTDQGKIAINCSETLSSDAMATVFNSVGQRVGTKALTGNVTLTDNPMTAGVYVVSIINAGRKITEKIIIR